ncbi:GTP pyrophosphokinase family protein [Microbacterium sp. MYb64]|uniref:GTP pyrophosphokinase n=1 Tax=Microbacterium sp. MYb64 TaxID=1848691 RepID=UPI000CFC4911|nr:hypothetical protein [Microbacterium sp. MYb64]PRB02295.1 hypothetical protein CQ044_15490 [Microbacterium sp. MYb64]
MVESQDAGYASRQALLVPLGNKVERLVRELIETTGLTVLDVVHRVKGQQSATKKVRANPARYGSFGDLHDMLGLRVITYLASDVDTVVSVLRANFDIDEDRSLDKQTSLDPDRFGYLSNHLVATTSTARSTLAEWAPYRGIYFEIQIRSILQHAWAEIEHDLGYKSTSGIPVHLRRRFARLASLLELADSEFDAVSREVADHVQRVEAVVADGGNLAIDRDSIRALVTSDGPVARADLAISSGIGAKLNDQMSRGYADARADELVAVGYQNTERVAESVSRNFDALVDFAVNWFNLPDPVAIDPADEFVDEDRDSDGKYRTLSPGISLFYLYLHERLQQPEGEQELTNIHHLKIPEVRTAFRRVHDEAFVDPFGAKY